MRGSSGCGRRSRTSAGSTQPDPVQAWRDRLARLAEVSRRLNELRLDALHFEGPGTDLTIGLLPSSRWISGQMTNVDNIVHTANLPTEEVFTAPDPARVDGTVTSTKPLFTSGTIVAGLPRPSTAAARSRSRPSTAPERCAT